MSKREPKTWTGKRWAVVTGTALSVDGWHAGQGNAPRIFWQRDAALAWGAPVRVRVTIEPVRKAARAALRRSKQP